MNVKPDNTWQKIKKMISELPEPYQKKALKILDECSRTQSIFEKRIYKSRLLTVCCESLKDLSTKERRKFCRELRMLLRQI